MDADQSIMSSLRQYNTCDHCRDIVVLHIDDNDGFTVMDVRNWANCFLYSYCPQDYYPLFSRIDRLTMDRIVFTAVKNHSQL